MLSKRAPVIGIVAGTQVIGMAFALVAAVARGEPLPQGTDLAWSVVCGVCGVFGITALYRGLAVGRMGVVAPVTGIMAAVIPVGFGFLTEGVPGPAVLIGIAAALLAVVFVTRAPAHDDGRPSGIRWAVLAGLGIGLFNVGIGQLSGAGAFGPLVLIRLVQAVLLGGLLLATRPTWHVERGLYGRLVVVGFLDMAGNAAFILATQAGQLAIASVLSSLYPVATVLLAIVILRERLTRSHLVGIALTAVAIALIGLGSATL